MLLVLVHRKRPRRSGIVGEQIRAKEAELIAETAARIIPPGSIPELVLVDDPMKWEYGFASILRLLRKSGSLKPGTTVRILRYEEGLIFRTKCIVEGSHEAWELDAGYRGAAVGTVRMACQE
jgi:hypothetical protein